MIRVCLAMVHTDGGHFRQRIVGGGVKFGTTEEYCTYDWLVILDEPPRGFVTDVPRGRWIVMLTEPPEVKTYSTGYLEQFGAVIAPMPLSGYSSRYCGHMRRCRGSMGMRP